MGRNWLTSLVLIVLGMKDAIIRAASVCPRQVAYEAVASNEHDKYSCAGSAQICLYSITTDYNGPLKHVNAHADDEDTIW